MRGKTRLRTDILSVPELTRVGGIPYTLPSLRFWPEFFAALLLIHMERVKGRI